MDLNDILNYLCVFILFLGKERVVVVHPLNGPVGRDLHNVEVVDADELVLLGLGGTRHARKLFKHAEIVLIGYRCDGLVLVLDLNAFLGFERLMQTVRITPSDHYAAREGIHYENLPVGHDIVLIKIEERVCTERLLDVVVQLGVVRSRDILNIEIGLRLAHTLLGQRHGARLDIAHIVAALGLGLAHLHIELGELNKILASGKAANEAIRPLIHIGRFAARAGDDERRSRFIDQNGVHLVNNSVGKAALNEAFPADRHIIPEVVESELAVRAVGDVACVCRLLLGGLHLAHDTADRKAEKAVYLAHPRRVAGSEVFIDRNDVNALAGERV